MVSPIYIIEAVAFVDFLGVGLFIPSLMFHARKIGGSHIQVGLLRSIYSMFQLCSGPLIGSMSDLKGRKPVLITTLLMSSVCYILMGFTTSIYALFVLRAIVGLVKQTQMLTKAMVPDYERNQQKQAEIYGKLMAASGAGLTLGPLMGGYVEETYERSFTFVALFVGLCILTNAGLILLLPSPPRSRRMSRCRISLQPGNIIQLFYRSLRQSFVALYDVEWSHYGDIFIFKVCMCFAMGVYFAIYAAYLKETFGLTPKYIGGIISCQSIVGSVSCWFICYINSFYTHDKDCTTRNFHVFILLSSAYLGLILAPNVSFFVIWVVPLAIGNSVSRLVTLEMVLNRSRGAHRGKLIGASISVGSLCGVITPMIAGMIGEWLGLRYVFYASLLSTSLGILLSYRSKRKSMIGKCD